MIKFVKILSVLVALVVLTMGEGMEDREKETEGELALLGDVSRVR